VVAILIGGSASRASAQVSVQTILTNGPASNRVNIVLLSEGYTSAELPQFAADATNAVRALLSHAPYQEYSNYFNASAIKVASNESGSDHPYNGIYRDTYFSSTYDPLSDRLITIPPNFADTNYSHGQGKVDALLTNTPRWHLPILLVNDFTDGGSDGFDKTAIAASSYQLPEILTHETGHLLANLGDEYTDSYPGFPDTEEPNTTQQTNRSLIKWNAWISANTPVPTTPPDSYPTVIGLFQGAHYHTNGWYRPKLDCLMRAQYAPFCEVCSEALVLAIYQRIRPVDGFAPVSTNLSVTTTQALAFSAVLLQPATHNLSVQWHTNGIAWTGATNLSFSVLPRSFPNGTNWVSALVRDNTPLVRNDPTNLLAQTISWKLNVSLPELRLDSPRWLAGGKFAFRVSGTAAQPVVVQSSTNPSGWGAVWTNSLTNGSFWYTNPSASSSLRRFYRATTSP
jgi:hypothetical protein